MWAINLPVATPSVRRYPAAAFQRLGRDLPFMHEQSMRSSARIGMNRHRKDELIVFAVEVIEVVSPHVFNVSRVDEAVTVGNVLAEHEWWEVI